MLSIFFVRSSQFRSMLQQALIAWSDFLKELAKTHLGLWAILISVYSVGSSVGGHLSALLWSYLFIVDSNPPGLIAVDHRLKNPMRNIVNEVFELERGGRGVVWMASSSNMPLAQILRDGNSMAPELQFFDPPLERCGQRANFQEFSSRGVLGCDMSVTVFSPKVTHPVFLEHDPGARRQ